MKKKDTQNFKLEMNFGIGNKKVIVKLLIEATMDKLTNTCYINKIHKLFIRYLTIKNNKQY